MSETIVTTGALYVRHARAADRGAWSVERDVDWKAIDARVALSQPDILAKLRDAALIESFHPVNLSRLIRLTWDDIDAGVVFSLEMFEGFKHFHALRTYLDAVGYGPAITNDDLRAIRERAERGDLDPADAMTPLVEFMLSEHLAAYFFRRLSEQAREPQLAAMLELIAADEVRHAQSASDLIAKRLAVNPELKPGVLRAATRFKHYGTEAVGGGDVPVAMEGDEIAIRTFAGRIERLCGTRLVDHLKTEMEL
ncbi:MAG TPA: ferritin-like domain-containing protein [Gemmatimonadaceae bacterium]|nr:ferritin-like domain-containing protein [Gemmatimonadaceae bacterium]